MPRVKGRQHAFKQFMIADCGLAIIEEEAELAYAIVARGYGGAEN